MFSETRYALNGDLRVAYRASREGPRDIEIVPSWFTCCEIVPELPSIQGWIEAMTSLGRLIFFDQPEPTPHPDHQQSRSPRQQTRTFKRGNQQPHARILT